MKRITLFFMLFILYSTFSQEKYSISGRIFLVIDKDTLPYSEGISISLKSPKRHIESDSLGVFKFKNLKKGRYKLKILNGRFRKIIINDKSVEDYN